MKNSLLSLNGTADGMASYARVIGLRAVDLFGVSTLIFLAVAAGLTAAHALACFAHLVTASCYARARPSTPLRASKNQLPADELESLDSAAASQPAGNRTRPIGKASAVAAAARLWLPILTGNLVRLLLLFHLPLVAFSTFSLSLSRTGASSSSVALAAVSLVVLGLFIPSLLVYQVRCSPSELREGEYRSLALGPMVDSFTDGNRLFLGLQLVFSLLRGVVIGSLQSSGTAQAIIILVFEILETLIVTLWLPWGESAAQGPLDFIIRISRIVIAVMLVVLAPVVGVSFSAAAWSVPLRLQR